MRKIAILLAVLVLFQTDCIKQRKKVEKSRPPLVVHSVLMDCETGDCLFEKNSLERCVPSSMTKLMTAYLLFARLASGEIRLDDEFPVSLAAQKMPGSRSFFKAGMMIRVEDLIRSVVVHSGNDACVVVAEGLAGDVNAFAVLMNEKAEEFGLQNTHFSNPNGIPEEGHFSCVHDLAVICRRLILDFPQFYHYFGEKVFRINGVTQQNRNTLLGNALGVDGLKTGKTDAGGYGVAASAESGGKRLIAVVNGCRSNRDRAQEANKLLSMGFREFSSFKITEAGKPIAKAKVWLGVKEEVDLCTHEDVVISVPRRYEKLLKVKVKLSEPVDAPVILGTKIGELTCSYKNFTSKKHDLFPCEPVQRAGFLRRAAVSLKHLIFGTP